MTLMVQVTEARLLGRFAQLLKVLLPCLALALSGFFAARQLSTWPVRLRYPGELNSMEGRGVAEMTLFREGDPIYAPASPGSFHATIYGPLFYLLGSRLVDPLQPAYRPLRMLAALATLGLAAACGLLAWWMTASYAATVMTALMFLSYQFVSLFGVCARSDSLALLLWFSGFLTAYRFQGSNKVLWSIPLMVLGAYYKQQFIVTPLAVLLFLLLEKRFRLAFQFAALLGAAGLILAGVFEFIVFRRQAFLLHFLSYNLIPFAWKEGLTWLRLICIIFLIPCFMALGCLRLRPDKLLACYFGWAVLLLPIMISKQGSGMHYCLELILVVCPLVASLVTMRLDRSVYAVFLIYFLGVALWLGQFAGPRNANPSPQDFTEDRNVQAFLHGSLPNHTPGLGDFTGDLWRAGLPTPITDLYQYTWLACEGRVEDGSLVAQLRQRHFGVILLANDLTNASDRGGFCFTEPLRQAILQNYRLAETFEFHLVEQRHYYAWVPRS